MVTVLTMTKCTFFINFDKSLQNQYCKWLDNEGTDGLKFYVLKNLQINPP